MTSEQIQNNDPVLPPSHPRHLADAALCVAPMMAWTDRHCRFLHRQLAPNALLFTEMVTSSALLRGPSHRLLRHHEAERPVALQLGGSEPAELAAAASLGAAQGFQEINLNVGCPSPRVKKGAFGACLMLEPARVARCVAAMRQAVTIPVTVKCRLGVDDQDSDELLLSFCQQVIDAGAQRLYLHARKALLNGLSPAQNRQIPPLQYERVHRLAARLSVPVIINGGITDAATATTQRQLCHGVMLGRAAYHNPLLLAELEHRWQIASIAGGAQRTASGGFNAKATAMAAYAAYQTYAAMELANGTRLQTLVKPVLGLFNGWPGARKYRQHLSDNKRLRQNDPIVLQEAVDQLQGLAA